MRYSWSFLLIVSGVLTIWEMSHHQRPEIVVSKETAIYVIGDSISAGMGAGIIVWPQVLAEQAMLRVVNLAQPGAKVRDGIRQAEQISEAPALVILEIGGNDLLGDTDASSFRADLDILVQELVGHGHSVLMMELPLFPFQNGYGEAQREIAAEYDVQLLPKRALTQVLGVPGSTSDGLHLSQVGHNAMAEVLVEVMKLR